MIFRTLILLTYLSLAPCSLNGETKPASDQPEWEYTATSGASFSSGNSDSLAYSLQFLGTYCDPHKDISFGANYYHIEYESVKSTDIFSHLV